MGDVTYAFGASAEFQDCKITVQAIFDGLE
jgi:hypothetical protein